MGATFSPLSRDERELITGSWTPHVTAVKCPEMTVVIKSAMGRDRRSRMRSLIQKAGLLAAAFMVLATGSARASTVEVQVPFSFVVHGQTLPAGHYLVNDDGGVVQVRGDKGNHASMFVLTIPASGHDPAANSPALTFQRHENQYWLTDIWQSATQGREITGW